MRILMLNNEYPPLGGGTGTVNQALLQRFDGHPEIQIDLVTSAGPEPDTALNLGKNLRLFKLRDGRRDIHHASNRDLAAYALRAFPFAARLYRDCPYQLVMAWSGVPAGVVAWLLKKRFGLPYIVRVSGPDIPGFEERYGWLYPLLTPMIRQVWRGAGRVVAKCQDEARMIRRVENRPLPIEIIPNGVDLGRFPLAHGSPADGPLHILCVARLIERKGQRLLIQAARRLMDAALPVQIHLVGDGDSLLAYQALGAELGVQEQVHFLGYIPREQIAAHYAAADVFVLPSFNEGMSVATLEAMAAGLPIVATRAGGMEELVLPGENGFLFDWNDLEALVAVLSRFAQDRSLARQLGAASRQRAQLFTWDGAAAAFSDLFLLRKRAVTPVVG